MDDADLETAILAIVGLCEQQRDLSADFLETLKIHRRRMDAIEATLDDALASLMNVPASIRLLLAMKASTLTMTCAKCGTEYAKEPGPELCGPCWVAAGRPGTIGLHAV